MFVSLRVMAAACAAAGALALAFPADALVVGAYHILPLPHYYEKTGRLPPGGGDGPMVYYGGSVFSNVRVVTVIWGDQVDKQTIDAMPTFSADIVNSTYMDQMAEYGTVHHKGVNGHGSTKQHIHRGTYFGQVQITPKHNGQQITDADIRKELSLQIANGVLPLNDLNTLYMIYFPSERDDRSERPDFMPGFRRLSFCEKDRRAEGQQYFLHRGAGVRFGLRLSDLCRVA